MSATLSRQRFLPFPAATLVAGLFGFLAFPVAAFSAGREMDATASTKSILKAHCFDCHSHQHAEADINLERMLADANSFAKEFSTWRTAVRMLEQNLMPPADAAQPSQANRERLIKALRNKINQTSLEHADDPGVVSVRRLTGAEYNYTITDLTGWDLQLHRQLAGDAAGGEGFSNVGLVQFMQDSTLEQYLQTAKRIASHAVIGAGPLYFSESPGKTGQELAAIAKIQAIYRKHGFRTAAGEGGESYGLDRYPKAFFAAWRYKHRDRLGLDNATWETLAIAEGLDVRFVKHMWSVLTIATPSFPSSEVVSRWQKLPAPEHGETDHAAVREKCRDIHQVLLDWQGRFGTNPDAKEEAALLAADTFDASLDQPFEMNINWPKGTPAAHLHVKVQLANKDGESPAVVVWKNPRVQFRMHDGRLTEFQSLRTILDSKSVGELQFGRHPQGMKIGPHDFVTEKSGSPVIPIRIPDDARSARLQVDAELDVVHGKDCIVRCTISQREDTDQGKSVSGILANPRHADYSRWKAGVLDFARLLPQVSQREPAPSDRDPIPSPFDGSYNNPERNLFHYKIKYHRDDAFLVQNILDDATRKELDIAWMDLLGSFEYHDAFLRFVAKKADRDLKSQTIATLEPAWIQQLPAGFQKPVAKLHRDYEKAQAAVHLAQAGHLQDALAFARKAWRRPLSSLEENRLRTYYHQLISEDDLDHDSAIRALVTRILVAPEFLYRTEKIAASDQPVPLSQWELASRLSYFLWSSLPDDELNRAATAGELHDPKLLVKQARRMLRDPKAKRFAAEFFGQWFGFYRFDEYQGIDTKRFPEFTEELKSAMHQEAVLFFEQIVRDNRPVNEVLFADYVFVNPQLARHYGLKDLDSQAAGFQEMENVAGYNRGGLLGLGAVLTVTSAPLRTSPVKRGDWVLRRVLGTPVPPPPADAGSIPADDVQNDGLTVKGRLAAHRRDATCNNCHSRIDPLGFALEQYDPLGRFRERYRDGQIVDAGGELRDGSPIAGAIGLRNYLKTHQQSFERTLCAKLVGYALGRSESIADAHLIQQMLAGLSEDDRFAMLVEKIVTSRQFRYQRGTQKAAEPSADSSTSNKN